jgi:antitoxin CptB
MNDARKKMLYQSWHRGCKETDVVLGPFAEAFLPQCSDEELDAFTVLLDENDWDIWHWLTNAGTAPAAHATMVERIITWQLARH